MKIIDSIILGAVEGLSEFLPISSTGHLILAGKILEIPSTEFFKSFLIIIQLGAIAAVIVIYLRDFFNWATLKKIIVGTIPTAIIGFGFYKIIKNNLLESESVVLWAILLGGIILIIFEMFYRGPDVPREEAREITYSQALYIGIFQSLAVIPGVSRSAASILGGLMLGIPRATIVKYSFLLAVPTIAGATLLDVAKNPTMFQATGLTPLLIGFFTAFIVAFFSIKFLLRFIKKNTFTPFGIYRVILAIAFFLLVA